MASQTPQSSEKPSGTILLGKYELGRRLGTGSFAKVHVARSIQTGEVVAIKIIDKKKTAEAGMEPRIIREIEAMRRLHHHPNVLKIHEVMATKSKIYLVMELAAGGELYTKIINHGRLNESAARRYFQQLASALSFCHGDGIAHRDVKPQNLLLDKQDNLKLSDFGLSALSEHRAIDGLLYTACGTPAYTAPEIIAQRGYDGAKADAWSCGVLLFVLLAGYVPFDNSNIVAMYMKIQRRDYRFPSCISKPARSIIYKMLDPNPETRMSVEDVMGKKWFQKSLETTEVVSCNNVVLDSDVVSEKSITAFDLIGLAPGLDLSGMFESRKRKEMRFTARVSAEGVVEKVKNIGEKLGFRVEKKKEAARAVELGKGRTTVVVEAVDVAEGFVVAEVKVAEGKEEEEEAHLSEVIVELEEIVLAWHNDVI